MFQYHCLNPISERGLELFSKDYQKADQLEGAQAVLVRSANMLEMEIPQSVAAIARAGAGVNNIPLDKRKWRKGAGARRYAAGLP